MPDETPEQTDPFIGVSLGAQLPTDEELIEFCGKVTNLQKAHEAALANDAKLMEGRRAVIDAAADSVRGLNLPPGELSKVTNAAKQRADEQFRAYRAQLLEASRESRQGILKQLNAAHEKASLVTRVFASPIQLLTSYGLGTEDRSRYVQQVAHAGPAELTTLARFATAAGNHVLAAAILGRLDTLPKESRPFSAARLANVMVGQRYEALSRAAKSIGNAFQKVINAERAHTTGKPNPVNKIADALRARELEND